MKREEDQVVTLSNCESEPILTSGAIQPHGLLFVVDYKLRILQVSLNTDQFIGYKANSLLEQNLSSIFIDDKLASLNEYLSFKNLQTLVPLPLTITCSDGSPYKSTCQAHKYADYFILEFESMQDDHLHDVLSISGVLANAIAQLQTTHNLEKALEIAATEVKRITGYDRVMVYKFDRDWHGEVIAEAREENLEPLLGLHYPAADIPAQARELYKKNLLRIIADVDYNSCALEPQINKKTNAILNMSDCTLRSVSPIHVEYLKNMGVGATLTISLMVKGELWGLIACHHYSPKTLPLAKRAACQMFAQNLSLALYGFIETERYKLEAINVRAFDDFLAIIRVTNGDVTKAFEVCGSKFIETFNCSGTALFTRDRIFAIGETLPAEEIRKAMGLIERLNKLVFSTDSICSIENFKSESTLAGMLAWKISTVNNDWIICFRPEQARSVRWAGQPQKEAETADSVTRLTPRGSFALWVEQVKNTSAPWTDQNIETADFLRQKILELRKETLDRNKIDLNKSMTARDEFVANIAHDLKTPILGAIRVLEYIRNINIGEADPRDLRDENKTTLDHSLKGHGKALNCATCEEAAETGATNLNRANGLRPIIDQLINSHQQLFERVKSILILYQYSEDTAPLSVEKLSLEAMLRNAIDMSMPLATSAEIKLEFDVVNNAFTVGDRDAFHRVFENLLSNAIKFSEDGGRVRISLEANDSTATVRVHDNGQGVPEEELGFLFKRFWRGSSGKKYTSGTGLGLHVCSKIIESHRGKIWCESVAGKGTTFFVELPAQKENQALTADV